MTMEEKIMEKNRTVQVREINVRVDRWSTLENVREDRARPCTIEARFVRVPFSIYVRKVFVFCVEIAKEWGLLVFYRRADWFILL